MITTTFLKSAVRPASSVKRASPSTWSNTSKIAGDAFSISSSRTTENGRRRTADTSLPSWSRLPRNRGTASQPENSLMSKRAMRWSEPNRKVARALAVSVLPTPVGPTNRKLPRGRPMSDSPALMTVTRSVISDTAWSWPMSRRWKAARISSAGSFSSSRTKNSGRPVSVQKWRTTTRRSTRSVPSAAAVSATRRSR